MDDLFKEFAEERPQGEWQTSEIRSTAKKPASGSTAKKPASGSTAKKPASGSTAKKPASGSTAKKPASGSTAKKPASGSTAKKPASGSTAKKPASGSTAKKPASGSTAKKPASGSTAKKRPSTGGRKKKGSGGLVEILDDLLSGKLGGKDKSLLASLAERLVERVGLSPKAAETVVGWLLGRLAGTSGKVSAGDVDQPGMGGAGLLDLVGLLGGIAGGRSLPQEGVSPTLAQEMAQETGLDPDTAAASLREVLRALGGAPEGEA